MAKDHKPYPCHQCELPGINRIAGQLEGIKKMIDERRYCPDILVQLRAVRAAIKSVEANILESHLKSCVADTMTSGTAGDKEQKIAELKELFKRFDD